MNVGNNNLLPKSYCSEEMTVKSGFTLYYGVYRGERLLYCDAAGSMWFYIIYIYYFYFLFFPDERCRELDFYYFNTPSSDFRS